MIYITILICFLASVLLTPLVKKFAFKVGAVDQPCQRKVHQKVMPRLGGLAIYLSFLIGVFIIHPTVKFHEEILLGSLVIILTGVVDDVKEISPKIKLLGQILAAYIVVFLGDLSVEFINLPFGGQIEFGAFSNILTMLWIIGVTNAINLIDGLDGLAGGVSSIALLTMAGMAVVMGDTYVMIIALIVAVSTIGFLFYNFYPAKIFMGDTGALFLGYIIAVLSLLGFKGVAFISFIVPVIILGVPITDTFFAIVRRLVNKQPLSAPDKSHVHHCLLKVGYSHRQSVLLIYAMSSIFGLAAFILSLSTLWGSLIVIIALILAIEFIVEKLGLIREDYQPLLKFLKGIKFANAKHKL